MTFLKYFTYLKFIIKIDEFLNYFKVKLHLIIYFIRILFILLYFILKITFQFYFILILYYLNYQSHFSELMVN